ncbi:MAG: PilT/PilU family type 4a pilus ATPase [Acidobacteria bacterium]|nr:MAG: PilT/PilU family type 4a pilus ATPase [Acidobacteriota bacterium]
MDNVVLVFDKILAKAREVGASDIHLCTGVLWKYRINGRIVPITGLNPLKKVEAEEIVRHVITTSNALLRGDLDNSIRSLTDLDLSYSLPGVSRFRVNICRQRGSFSMVLRLIPVDCPSIDDLNLPPVIREISHEERGLVLVTGVTGSGKSTTLAAMVREINLTTPCKIVTIEDPIEYLHSEVKASVIQREVGSDTRSFAKALRAALRQDPDIILVGEMRDRETIDIAMKAAETGHLVLSTLHTIDAPKTVQRIVSVFDLSEQKAVRMRLAETMKAVISQRLIRRKDKPGRVAVVEVMRSTRSIQECIENPEKTGAIKDHVECGRDQYGMQTFDQHLRDLYLAGIITMETAKSAATSPNDFERNLKFM